MLSFFEEHIKFHFPQKHKGSEVFPMTCQKAQKIETLRLDSILTRSDEFLTTEPRHNSRSTWKQNGYTTPVNLHASFPKSHNEFRL